MTNETTVVEKVTSAVCAQFSEGKDMAEQVTTWLTEKGLDFAMNLVFALVILLVGWLAIKLISLAVRKALMRGRAKGRLLADFVCSVVTKACWAVGDMNEPKNPWNINTAPRENLPSMVSHTPSISTTLLANILKNAGIIPRNWLTFALFTFCEFTDA